MATNDVNRAQLRELGFELGARAGAGESEGAWFATAPDGAPVVLKWFPDETMADRYLVLLPGLDELRSRGVPVPEYSQLGGERQHARVRTRGTRAPPAIRGDPREPAFAGPLKTPSARTH